MSVPTCKASDSLPVGLPIQYRVSGPRRLAASAEYAAYSATACRRQNRTSFRLASRTGSEPWQDALARIDTVQGKGGNQPPSDAGGPANKAVTRGAVTVAR